MSIGVLIEHDGGQLHPHSRRLIAAAKQCGDSILAIVAGKNISHIVETLKPYVDHVCFSESDLYEHARAEPLAVFLKEVVNQYSLTHLLAPANGFGKAILPRVAGLLRVSPIEGVVQIHSPHKYTRAMYAGNVLCDVISSNAIHCLTVMTAAFDLCKGSDSEASVESTQVLPDVRSAQWLSSTHQHADDSPQLATANRVMTIGRGVRADLIPRIQRLANHYGAALGATRAVVDAGLLPNECQVGQTGQNVAPELYVAWGVSGAVQHVAGMKGSKLVISINTDPQAPMVNVADYSLEEDVESVLDVWESCLGLS